MHDRVITGHGLQHRIELQYVYGMVRHVIASRGCQIEHPHGVPVLHQIVHNVFADGPGAACNQNFFHGAMVAAPTVPGVKRA